MRRITKAEYRKKVAEIVSLIRQTPPFEDTSSAAKRRRKARAKQDHFYFFNTYLPHYFPQPSAQFHREVIGLMEIRGIPVAVAAPREHAKTTLCTKAYPTHQIVFGLRHFYIPISDTKDQAADFTMAIRLELEENARIKQDFGDLRSVGGKWEDGDFVTRNNVRVLALGSRQKIRGRTHRQYRPDLVVIDDLENDRNVKNPRLVKVTVQWIKEATYPAVDTNGGLFFIGNLLSKKSVLAHYLKEEKWITRLYRAIQDDGTALWPGRLPLEVLLKKKEIMGSYAFNKEFQNDPRDEEGAFQEEWIRYYHPDELVGRALRSFTGIDPSAKEGENSCDKAIITIAIDPPEIFVRDAFVRQCSINQMVKAAYERYMEFHQLLMLLETNVFQELLLRDFNKEAAEKGFHLPLRGIDHRVAKDTRILRLSPLVERGIIRFQKGHSDQDKLIEQLLYFPSTLMNKDGPDALEMAVFAAEQFATMADFRSAGRRDAHRYPAYAAY